MYSKHKVLSLNEAAAAVPARVGVDEVAGRGGRVVDALRVALQLRPAQQPAISTQAAI